MLLKYIKEAGNMAQGLRTLVALPKPVGFCPQHSSGGSQSSPAPIPMDPMSSSDHPPSTQHACDTHMYMQTKYSYA